MKSYNELVKRVLMFRSFQTSTLDDAKRGLPALLIGRQSQIVSTLSWNVEGWMLAAHKLQWAEATQDLMERVSLEWVGMAEEGSEPEGDASDEDWWDAKAEAIIRSMASHAMYIVFQGVDSSSNPMTMLEGRQKVEAAKSALEAICGLHRHNLVGEEAMDNLFDGIASRELKWEVARALRVAKVTLAKRGGQFIASAFNHKEVMLRETNFPDVTRKGDAMRAAQAWANDLRIELNVDENGGYGYNITVETC